MKIGLERVEPGDTWDTIVAKLQKKTDAVQPSVKLGGYSTRFKSKEEEKYEQSPSEEFAILLYLVGEGGATVDENDLKVVKDVIGKKPMNQILEQLPASDPVKKAVHDAINAACGPL